MVLLAFQISAKKVAAWAETNILSLNTKKTQAIVFGSTTTLKHFTDLHINKITVNEKGDQVSFLNQVVNLGVTLDSTLTWRPQVNDVTKKVNRALYGLKLIRPCTSQALRKRLVESLVIPHLDYCNAVYSDFTQCSAPETV